MAKRIYSETDRKLFRFKEGSSWYTRIGSSDICLETSNAIVARTHLEYLQAQTERFGAVAFRKTVKKLFPIFLKEKAKEVSAETHHHYKSIWDTYFERSFGKLMIADINQKSWSSFCERTKTVSDFQNPRNLMIHFLKWCHLKSFLLGIPILKNPKHKRRKRKIIPKEHLELIFQNAHGSLLLFLSCALFMGMRRKEIMTLSYPYIDLIEKHLTLRDHLVKTRQGRQLPLNECVYKLLLERLRALKEAGIAPNWVFMNPRDPSRPMSLGGLMNPWRRCLLKSGLGRQVRSVGKKSKYHIEVDYTWHDLRATYEKYSNKSTEHTDTQREKMAGADISVQRRIYVTMDADDLRGLEEVVTKTLPSLGEIISRKTAALKKNMGKPVGKI